MSISFPIYIYTARCSNFKVPFLRTCSTGIETVIKSQSGRETTMVQYTTQSFRCTTSDEPRSRIAWGLVNIDGAVSCVLRRTFRGRMNEQWSRGLTDWADWYETWGLAMEIGQELRWTMGPDRDAGSACKCWQKRTFGSGEKS